MFGIDDAIIGGAMSGLGSIAGGLLGGGGEKQTSAYDQLQDIANGAWWLWGPGNSTWDQATSIYGDDTTAFQGMFDVLWNYLGGNTEQSMKDYVASLDSFRNTIASLPDEVKSTYQPVLDAYNNLGKKYLGVSDAATKSANQLSSEMASVQKAAQAAYKQGYEVELPAIQKEYERQYRNATANPSTVNFGGFSTGPITNYKATRELLAPITELAKERANPSALQNISNYITNRSNILNNGYSTAQNALSGYSGILGDTSSVLGNILNSKLTSTGMLQDIANAKNNLYMTPLNFAMQTSSNLTGGNYNQPTTTGTDWSTVLNTLGQGFNQYLKNSNKTDDEE